MKRGDDRYFETANVKMLLQVGEEDAEAVHDAVPDDIAHEAPEDRQPGPRASIRSDGRGCVLHVCCVRDPADFLVAAPASQCLTIDLMRGLAA